jgi:predicted nuclease with RNAse H fold
VARDPEKSWRFVGIDLASAPERTGVAVLTVTGPPGARRARATLAGDHFIADDDGLVALVGEHDVVGLDAPLGWPDNFVAAVSSHHHFEPWPLEPSVTPRETLRLRRTDLFVRSLGLGSTPLSVSSDLIGVVAMRAASLQSAWALGGPDEPRDGSGRLVETYPAVALRRWGLIEPRGVRYKGGPKELRGAQRETRREMLTRMGAKSGQWLDVDDGLAEAALNSDHLFDALICTLVALAAKGGVTSPPPTKADRESARREGWIHVPVGRFEDLSVAVESVATD